MEGIQYLLRFVEVTALAVQAAAIFFLAVRYYHKD
jgi:hypothetical protein